MRLQKPRIPPLSLDEPMKGGGIGGRGGGRNIFGTLAHHPDLAKGFMGLGSHVLGTNQLPPREREILILRIGWLCQSEYEWGQHVIIGKSAGLTDEEIGMIAEGPDADQWSDFDATLVRAADELHEDAFITDTTWNALAQQYDRNQLMDVVFTVGMYNMVSMALNSCGVQLEEGIEGFSHSPKKSTPS